MKAFVLFEKETGNCFDVIETGDDETPFPVHASLEWVDVTDFPVRPQHGWVSIVHEGGVREFYDPSVQNEAPFDALAHLVTVRDRVAHEYHYGGIIIHLGEGQRADITALYARLKAGELPADFILAWSENGYQDDPGLATIYISYADLSEFCEGALNQRVRAFAAYPLARANIGACETPEDVEAAFMTAFSSL